MSDLWNESFILVSRISYSPILNKYIVIAMHLRPLINLILILKNYINWSVCSIDGSRTKKTWSIDRLWYDWWLERVE